MTKVNDRNDWFDLWYADKQSILETMIRNMAADLLAGYNYNGNCIIGQRKAIDDYSSDINAALDKFADMDDKAVNRWCFYDMKKRGVIE